MNALTALAKWLGTLDPDQLTALLRERDLPLAAEDRRITTLRELAEHLLTDASVGRGLAAGTAGEVELLVSVSVSVSVLALEWHGPVAGDEADDGPRYPWQQRKPAPPPVEPADRLVPERDVLAWFEPGRSGGGPSGFSHGCGNGRCCSPHPWGNWPSHPCCTSAPPGSTATGARPTGC
ncbi:hypothetical protein ACFWBH_02495 [Streptomyces sp. NPDC059999]|uniref:hypothetical protein n=1 Tax=Streptomyces sp. NPDC059999 TaxID=3347030 RepID=UPI0036887FB6